MSSTAVLRRLGTLSVAQFLARYWQREALCIRQALPHFTSPVDAADLFTLAASEDVESRLVRADHRQGRRGAPEGGWQVDYGPFAARDLPSPRRPAWTLLVQGVDLHHAGVAALAQRFSFLPAARFDDVMISYASDGGGVGPHVDQYDVFLLQAQGRRRWRIARDYDPRLVEGLPLRVLSHFRHEQEWVLEPGDALYLPPGVAHEGVAQGECITISIGFRLSAWQEIAEAWSEHQARTAPRSGRVADTVRKPTRTPARLPAGLVAAAVQELRRTPPGTTSVRRTLLEHLSEPKPTVQFTPPRPQRGLVAFTRMAYRSGVMLDLRTRMLYEGPDLALNGELQDLADRLSKAGKPGARSVPALLRELADRRVLETRALRALDPTAAEPMLHLLHDWYTYGWLHLRVK